MKTKYYLLWIVCDVDPELLGPFDSAEKRDHKAKELKKEVGDEDGIYPLDVIGDIPNIWAWCSDFYNGV